MKDSRRRGDEDPEMSFVEHLEELRWRLIRAMVALVIGMVICFFLAEYILAFLTYPAEILDTPLNLQVLKVQGMLTVYLEIGFFGGLIIALPYLLYQLWGFIAPGLMKHERKYIVPLLFYSTSLFLGGVAFAYYTVLPFTIRFLISLTPSDITPGIAIDYYIGFAIRLMFLFGMVFELPVLSFFLGKIGIINTRLMRTYRRHSIVFIFVVAAVLTPPDPFTQLLLGVPLILLYEISIGVVHLVEKRRLKALQKQADLTETQNDTEPAG